MRKITLMFLLVTGVIWGQTVRVDVSELSNVSNVELLANFGGSFAFYQAVDEGGGLWTFDLSTSTDAQNEYKWRVTFADTSTQEEDLIATVAGQGLDNDVAIGQDFNTDFFSFCNRLVTIGGGDPPTTYFNSFRIPGVTYTELTLTAPAPGAGQNYYLFYGVNGWSEFGGPGAADNGDGTYTAIVRPDAAFEYKWVLNDDPGTVGADSQEDLLSCTNDGVTINTDNSTFANRIHAAGEDKMDEFGVCPDTGGGGPTSPYCDTEVFHFGGNADSVINLTIENTGSNSMLLTATNPGGFGGTPDFLGIAGVPPTGSSIGSPMPITGGVTLELTWAGAPPADVIFEFIQWRKTGTGGATWQLGEMAPNATVPFDAICGNAAQDISLSDLQIDGMTIAGFDPNTRTYDIGLATATPVPVVTLVTTTNPSASVGTITQATAVPGTATFDVTSEDTTVTETYTINFTLQGMLTELVGNGSFETGDFTDWQQFPSGPGGSQTVQAVNPSEGMFAANIDNPNLASASIIKSANRGIGIVGPGDEVTISFDMRGATADGGVVFAELFSEISGGGASQSEILGGGPIFPNADPNTWTTFEFTTTVGPDVSGGITLQFAAVTGGAGASSANVWFDNVSMVNNDETLSIVEVTINEIKVYPNPTTDYWIVNSNQVVQDIQVYDMLGKLVVDMKTQDEVISIDATGLKSGLYFARISSEAGTQTLKLVKE